MYTDFHERYLAKVVAMNLLSQLAGFRGTGLPIKLAGAQIENDPSKRRSVLISLTNENFIEARLLGETSYTITDKAFNNSEVQEYVGELNIGTPNSPFATWLSGPMMKQAIEDLISSKSVIKDSTTGKGKVVVSTIDGRSNDDVLFDRHLSMNLGDIACRLTEMSNSFSECLRVPPNSITSKDIASQLTQLHKENKKEIQRLKRTNDSLSVLFSEVDLTGGWDEFITKARDQFELAKTPKTLSETAA